jgi:hypothetical protein
MEKSANKRWKESGSTLTFKQWLEREDKKNDSKNSNFLPFDSSVSQTQQQINESIKSDIQNVDIGINNNYQEDKTKFLGLDKTTFVFAGILILGSLTYYFIKRAKANK